MATFYKILGYLILIIAGLISLYGEWRYVVVNVGWVDPITFLLLSPLELVFVPFILALQGHFQLLIITYGGGALGAFFVATGSKLEGKPIPRDHELN
jgi:putative effector of murein hydrolase LrgA (UPF0299 family)